MRVVENLSTFDGTVTYSSFVLVTVDIAASIHGVTDQAAIRAAEALPRAKCPAWIRMYTRRVGSPLFHVVFLLVGRGLPAPPLSFAAVPIAPNASHPDTGRDAVVPSRPFPWPDCYIYTLQSLTAPISRLCESPEDGIMLDDEQTKPVLLACFKDASTEADLDSGSTESDDDDLPAGVRIRDHGSYASIVDGEASSGNEASSRRSASGKHLDPGRAAQAGTEDAASSRSSSSVDGPMENQHASANVVQEVAEKGIVLQLEVSGILDPSDEFGTAEDLLAVVKRLSEIEEERAERAATARLAQAVAPKATAWLQGISAADGFDDAAGDPRDGRPGPRSELDDVPGNPVAVSDTGIEPQSATSPNEVLQRERTSPARPRSPTAQSPDDSARASSPQPPNGVDVSAPVPEDARPDREARQELDARAPSEAASAHESARALAPRTDAPRDLEAAALAPSAGKAAEHDGSPRRRTLRALLSSLVSRLRAFVARCRALF